MWLLVNKSCIFCVVLIFFCLAVTAPGKVIYVDDDATGANNGSSWQDAYHYLQDALADANSAGKPVEIRVAQGIYKPDQGANQTAGDRTATFQLINAVTLKGGYAGFAEPDPNARDISIYETILSGDLASNDVGVKEPCELLDESSRTENSYHVVTSIKTGQAVVLDGFTIIGGQMSAIDMGGPIGGGGMFISFASPTISHCTFAGNAARDSGGGILCAGNSRPSFVNCVVRANYAGYGGGIRSEGPNGNPTLSNCIFDGNGAYGGGAMYNYSGSLTMTNCIFSGNTAELGGGICNLRACSVTLATCTFAANSAAKGNAVACNSYQRRYPSNVRITNCILWDGGDEIWNNDGSRIVIGDSNIQGGKAAVYDPCDGLVWGVGNINADPRFFDAGHWEDPCDTPDDPLDDVWVDGDYHLKSQAGRWEPTGNSKLEILNSKLRNGKWVHDDVTSPCIDAGDPNSPIGHEPFPNGGIVNMGAYGGTAQASKSYFGEPVCETIVAGDINGDCKVDFEDLAILASRWLTGN